MREDWPDADELPMMTYRIIGHGGELQPDETLPSRQQEVEDWYFVKKAELRAKELALTLAWVVWTLAAVALAVTARSLGLG